MLLLHFLFLSPFPQPKTQIKNPGGGLAYVNVVGLKLVCLILLDGECSQLQGGVIEMEST